MSSPSLKEVDGKDSENASNSSGRSSNSNGEGGGNNSDNSALVSLGNTSFGFNFDGDMEFNNSSGSNSPDEGDSDHGNNNNNTHNSYSDRKNRNSRKQVSGSSNSSKASSSHKSNNGNNSSSNSSSSSQNSNSSKDRRAAKMDAATQETSSATPNNEGGSSEEEMKQSQSNSHNNAMSAGAAAAKSKTDSMKPPPPLPLAANSSNSAMADAVDSSGEHLDAAATAVANLNQIATDALKKSEEENEDGEKRGMKRKSDDDSGGYNSDDEDENGNSHMNDETDASCSENTSSAGPTTNKGNAGKKKKLDENKREERNAREKERSFRISKQINELRALLSSGGVIVPKGTKSSVLTEAANYIRMLQQHQYRSEIDRHQLVQQVQRIGSGALGQQAASAVRHVAAQNGVWSLGNFGGVPPKSAMLYHQSSATGGPVADETQSGVSTSSGSLSSTIEEADYRHVFNAATIGMAIASMGGAIIDCNKFFCQVSNYTKQEICSLTVFNLTARQDLQSAFDLISQMLSAPLDPTVTNTSCVLRGALKNRTDVGLSVKLIKGSDGVAKYFCVTLIQNPTSPFDISRPKPATASVGDQGEGQGQGQMVPGPKDPSQSGLDPAPAYTTG